MIIMYIKPSMILKGLLSKPSQRKLMKVIKRYSIKFTIDKSQKARGHTNGIDPIIILSPNFDLYSILHEIGHIITGYGCCREHEEYISHGIAIGIAESMNINLNIDFYDEISPYANRSLGCAYLDVDVKKPIIMNEHNKRLRSLKKKTNN